MDLEKQISPYSFLTAEEAEEIRRVFPTDKDLSYLALFFKMFGDHTRLRILFLLNRCEISVGDLAALLDMTPSAVSHQLKLLKGTGLVTFRRVGKTLFYSLADRHVQNILEIGLEHVKE